MFEKNTNQIDKYKLNKQTELQVKNTRIEKNGIFGGYDIGVTLKHKVYSDKEPLGFSTADEISDFVNNIDLTEDQLRLPGTKSEK